VTGKGKRGTQSKQSVWSWTCDSIHRCLVAATVLTPLPKRCPYRSAERRPQAGERQAAGKRLEAEHLLEFKQMFTPGLLALAVPFPGLSIDVDLLRDVAQQRRIGLVTDAQDEVLSRLRKFSPKTRFRASMGSLFHKGFRFADKSVFW
jgi:hypothetical protein